MVYEVYATENFEDQFKVLTNEEKKIIQKLFLQLKESPYVGDAIRYRFFREKRIKEKRMYYLIYDDLSTILIVALGGKKEQQKTINEIIQDLPEFKKYIKKLLRKS